jgi:hypothetical protein
MAHLSQKLQCMHAHPRGHALLAIAGAAAALLPPCATAAKDKPQAYEVDAGFDSAPRSVTWYSDGIVALNGNIAKDGFLLRSYGSLSVYQYASPIIEADTINGQLWQMDLMPGYQIVRGAATIGGFIGIDFQDSLLSPQDPTNKLRGTATGAKVEAHYFFADDKQPFDVRLVGEYSTAFETYYAELRVGARICDKLFVGPDAAVDGDTGYNAQRLGGYVKYSFELAKGVPAELSAGAGHQFVSGDTSSGFGGGAGTYATLELDTNF